LAGVMQGCADIQAAESRVSRAVVERAEKSASMR